MWHRCAYWSGVALIAVALVALPAASIVASYVGGSALGGHVEDGRYFVNPGHGQPIVEVSESTWRKVYWLERPWPFSALVPGLAGLFLLACGLGPSWQPPPPLPAQMPTWVLRACMVSVGIVLAGAWACWVVFRAPWAV